MPDAKRKAAKRQGRPKRQTSAETPEVGCYVYGILSSSTDLPLGELPAMDEAFPIRAIRHGKLQALVSDVRIGDFGDAAVDQHDVEWLAGKARDHDRVARAAAGRCAFVPFRFCTVLKEEKNVLELLKSNQAELLAVLADLEGKKEWGVRITLSGRFQLQSKPSSVSHDGSGKAYLLRKQQQLQANRESEQAALTLAEACHRKLEEIVSAAALLSPRKATESSEGRTLVNGAYLVPDQVIEKFKHRVAELRETHRKTGLEFHLTGPWPTYSFVNLDLSQSTAIS